MAKSVIITCAVTGSIHTPTMSEYLPITPNEIAEGAIAAAEAGASILHLHARNADGSPTPSPETFMEFLPRIKQSTDAVVNITTGGGHGMTLEERCAGAQRSGLQRTFGGGAGAGRADHDEQEDLRGRDGHARAPVDQIQPSEVRAAGQDVGGDRPGQHREAGGADRGSVWDGDHVL